MSEFIVTIKCALSKEVVAAMRVEASSHEVVVRRLELINKPDAELITHVEIPPNRGLSYRELNEEAWKLRFEGYVGKRGDAKAFCEKYKCSTQIFYYWKKKLGIL